MRCAVYVEGQSELLFVADVLSKYSAYDSERCGFLCINLSADDFERMTFPQQGDETSRDYYQIVNVNNDNRVVSRLKKDIPGLLQSGYNVVIGLKDVYGNAYEQIAGGRPVIDRAKIEMMHSVQTEAIMAPAGSDCRLHFAIMEYESWMLALIERYVAGRGKDFAEICKKLGIERNCDFEQCVFHPYPLAQKIFQECGEDYHKHGKESFSFLSFLTVEDYEALRHSGRCASFAKFIDSLLGSRCPKLP